MKRRSLWPLRIARVGVFGIVPGCVLSLAFPDRSVWNSVGMFLAAGGVLVWLLMFCVDSS